MAIAQLFAFCWVYGIRRLCDDVRFMMGQPVRLHWRISWGIVAPLLMLVIFVYALVIFQPLTYNNQTFPTGIYGNCVIDCKTKSYLTSVFFYPMRSDQRSVGVCGPSVYCKFPAGWRSKCTVRKATPFGRKSNGHLKRIENRVHWIANCTLNMWNI